MLNISRPTKKTDQTRINLDIRAPEVRLIDPDGEQLGIVPIKEALQQAKDFGMDLVEMAANASPPVCRIMNFGKFQYQKSKRDKVAKSKQRQMQIKEVRFRLVTEEADFRYKVDNLKRFLNRGDKAKVSLRFRGREAAQPELGMELMNRVAGALEEAGTVEAKPKQEGRQMIMILAPKVAKGK